MIHILPGQKNNLYKLMKALLNGATAVIVVEKTGGNHLNGAITASASIVLVPGGQERNNLS